MDDLSRQADEVEAMSSIFDNRWQIVDHSSSTYSMNIDVPSSSTSSVETLILQVTLPADYPSGSPPLYSISCPSLQSRDRICLSDKLEELYIKNLGESVLYIWVQGVIDYFESKRINDDEATSDEPTSEDASLPEERVEEIELPEIFSGEVLSDRRSVFQPFLAPIVHKGQVPMVIDKLRENKKIDVATHRIYSYRLQRELSGKQILIHGNDDDGEFGASARMLHLMEIVEAMNVLVIVVRWYGGVHLGPDRFKHISSLTRNILEEHGYIKEKHQKKNRPSKKKIK